MSLCSVTDRLLQHKLVQASFKNVPPYPELVALMLLNIENIYSSIYSAGSITGTASTVNLDFLDDKSFTGVQVP